MLSAPTTRRTTPTTQKDDVSVAHHPGVVQNDTTSKLDSLSWLEGAARYFEFDPDHAVARKLISLIHPEGVTEFRAIYEHPRRKKRKKQKKCVVVKGTLEEHWAALTRLNEQGYGIFFLVQQASKKSLASDKPARDRDIRGRNATHADIDKRPKELQGNQTNLERVMALNPRPDAVLQSSGEGNEENLHVYYINRRTARTRTEARQLQEQMKRDNLRLAAHLDGDPSAVNPSRVMRLPGTYNWKSGFPQMVRLVRAEQPTDESARNGGVGVVQEPPTPPYLIYGELSENESVTHFSNFTPDEAKRHAKMLRQYENDWRKFRSFPAAVQRQLGYTPSQSDGRYIDPSPEGRALTDRLRDCKNGTEYDFHLENGWPRKASFRQKLALCAAADLHRLGYRVGQAVAKIKRVCRAAGDEEVKARISAVYYAYQTIDDGGTVWGPLVGSSAARRLSFPAVAWGPPLSKIAPKERKAEARRRIEKALAHIKPRKDGFRPHSLRSLSLMTGISTKAVSSTLHLMHEEGVIEWVEEKGGSRYLNTAATPTERPLEPPKTRRTPHIPTQDRQQTPLRASERFSGQEIERRAA